VSYGPVRLMGQEIRYEVKGLSKKDFLVICGGANDIGKNNSAMALHQIMDFVATNTHTNIALITDPRDMI